MNQLDREVGALELTPNKDANKKNVPRKYKQVEKIPPNQEAEEETLHKSLVSIDKREAQKGITKPIIPKQLRAQAPLSLPKKVANELYLLQCQGFVSPYES